MLDVTFSSAIFASDGFDSTNHFDFSALESLTLTHETALLALADPTDAFYSVFNLAPTFSALTGELTVTYGDTSADAFVIEGDGLTPDTYATLDAFVTALENGIASGSFDTLRVIVGGTEILTVSLTETGVHFQSGDFYFNFQGSFPESTQDVFDFIVSAAELINGFGTLSNAELSTILGVIGDYGVNEFVLGEGDAELLSVTLTETQFKISLGGGSLEVNGTFPGMTISDGLEFYDALMTALGDGAVSMSELTDLDITSIEIVDMNGVDMIVVSGDFSDIEIDASGQPVSAISAPTITIEGSDSTEDGDDVVDVVFFESEAESVQINLNDGHDYFEMDGSLRNDYQDFLAPVTVDGGDGYDAVRVAEYESTSTSVDVDWTTGEIVASDSNGETYTVSFANIERVDIDLPGSSASVLGDDGNNRVRLIQIDGLFEFDGGDGWDRLELHRASNGEDAPEGFTLEELQAAFDFVVGDSGEISIKNAGEDDVIGVLSNVESIRLLVEQDGVDRADLGNTEDYVVSEVLGITDFTGTEDDDTIDGNGLDNLIEGLGGDDRLSGEGGNDTINGGAGDDGITVDAGSHEIDGGEGWNYLNFRDRDSDVFEMDFVNGTIQGFVGGSDTPEYTTTFSNIQGASSYSEGEVYVTATGDWLYFGLNVLPSYLSIDNGDGEGMLSLRWTNVGPDEYGITQDDILSDVEVVVVDGTGKNFDIYALDASGERDGKIGELRGITQIEFLNDDPDAESDSEQVSLKSIAVYDSVILGTNDVDDSLDGTDGYDVMDGLAGDDYLNAGDGPDDLYSDNYLTEGASAGNDTLDGGLGDDIYHVQGLAEEIVTIRDSGGDDTLVLYYYPGDFSVEFVWDGSTATQLSTVGHQIVIDADGALPAIENIKILGLTNDGESRYTQTLSLVVDQDDFTELGVVFAGSNNADVISAPDLDTSSEDAYYGEIFGNGGDDVITIFPQFTYAIYGGDGDDTITVDGGDGVHIPTDSSDEDPASQWVYGGIGNDVITTYTSDDNIWGDEGNDTIDAGLGSDYVSGGDGDDLYIHGSSGADADTFDGGDGVDTFYADLSGSEHGDFVLEVDLSSEDVGNAGAVDGENGRETLIDVESVEIIGSVDMEIIGNDADNSITTGSGNDTVFADQGDNVIDTGAGIDVIGVGRTNSTIDGGDGEDFLAIVDEESEVLVIDMDTGEATGQSNLTDAAEVYFTTVFSNIENVHWNNAQTVKLIGTGGSDVFSPMFAPEMLIIDNGDGTGTLDFTQIINDDDTFGLNVDELIPYIIRPTDATDKNFRVYVEVDGAEVQVAELTGVTQVSFLNALDETETITHPISTYALDFVLQVDGIASEDNTLSVDASLTGFSAPITYQWLRDGEEISGATESTYTLGQDDVGFPISVVVSGSGDGEEETTLATNDVANVNDETTGVPTISGTAQQGETLTASIDGIEDEDGIPDAVNYQWKRGGVDIDGATESTYELTVDDIGSAISVTVSFTDDHGDDVSLDSATTDAVVFDPDAELCDIDMGAHYEAYLTNQTVTDADIDGNPTFLTQYISDFVDRDGTVSDGTDYTLMADADPLEVSGTQEFNIRAFGTAVNNASYGIVLQDYEEDGAGDEDYASGNFAGASHSYVESTYGGTTHDSASGDVSTGTADGTLIVDGLMSVNLFDTGDGANSNPSFSGDDPGVATHQGNDADRGYNKTFGGDQYLEVLPGNDENGGVLLCFDQGTTVYGFALNFLGRQDDKRPVYLDIHFSDGSVYRTLTDSDGNQEGGEQYFSFLVDPDESDLSIMAVVFYEPFDTDEDNDGDRDIFSIDDLALVVDPDGGEATLDDRTILTSEEYVSALGVNTEPTGDVTITGTAEEGEVLTAVSTLADIDGLGPLHYQWLRDGDPIPDAVDDEYELDQADVGSVISVTVSYTDGIGTEESETSDPTETVTNTDDAPTGVLLILGTPTEGETLTAFTSALKDDDGLGDLAFQWLREGVEIPDATDAEYVLTSADVGQPISLRVSYTDGFDNLETFTSEETDSVANVNDPVTGDVVITGDATEGETLSADASGLSDADGMDGADPTYQWLRDGDPIDGATGVTYVLTGDDVGAAISVEVSFEDDHGSTESATSAATGAVENVNDDPVGEVLISGTNSEGETLTANAAGLSDADGLGDFSFQWLRDGDEIVGATGSTYNLVQADVDAEISVTVSYTDDHGKDESVTSDPTNPVTNVNTSPTGSVVINGLALEDATLTADTSGLADADGLGDFSYQWLRDGAPIGGATSETYDVTSDDADAAISVEVSYTDDQGTTESVTSDETDPVEGYVIDGTDGDDDLAGNSLDNEVNGFDGDDIMTGEEGNDTLDGGAGDNQMDGGEGNDTYIVDDSLEGSRTISDQSGSDWLVVAIQFDSDVFAFGNWAWDGMNVSRTGSNGNLTMINSVAGSAVIDFISFVPPEALDTGEFDWQYQFHLEVDVAEFTEHQTIFVGSDDAETIDAPELTTFNNVHFGVIAAAGGDDTVNLQTNYRMVVLAGEGDDTVTVGTEDDRGDGTVGHSVDGDEGNDDITLGAGDDTALGGDGDDTIRDGAGNDSIEGGDDDDLFFYTAGDIDDYDGGRGYDFIEIDLSDEDSSTFTFVIDLDDGAMGETGNLTDDLSSVEGVRVIGDVDVTATGDDAANTFDLDAGDDLVNAGDGDDAVYSGDGNDTVNGEDGDDFIEGDLGTNVIDGGEGTDTALYAGAYADYTVAVDGSGFDVTGTGVSDDVENVEIFSFSDQVFTAGMIRIGATNDGDDVGDGDSTDSQDLSSGGGDDSVTGGSGSDTVDAGADNDTVDGGAGSDTIDGGSGDDYVGGGAGDDEIFDGLGNDTIGGGEGSDTGIALSGNNSFVEDDETTDAADTSLDDYYAGGYGDDEFFGGGGNDVLVGDRGSAFYFGDDTMTGGTGDDILQGSGGADVFVFRSGDGDDTIGTVDLRTVGSATDITDVLITGADFEVGLDRVDLTDFGFASSAAVLALLSDSGGNAVLTTADGTITFYDILSADLGADDFII